MHDIAVVVPWASGCTHRERALTYVVQRWASERLPVVLGHSSAERWSKGLAVADALRRTDASLLVIADADVWTDGVFDAIQRVRSGSPWAVPHRMVHRLTPEATESVLRGRWFDESLPAAEPPYPGFAGGGMVVLPRSVYERVPLDPRFVGWGQEDESWATALRTLVGRPWRGSARMYHLWHPPQERRNRRYGNINSVNLWRKYRAASGRPRLMDKLLEVPRQSI
jgi:hypothetical protein